MADEQNFRRFREGAGLDVAAGGLRKTSALIKIEGIEYSNLLEFVQYLLFFI